MSPSSSIPTTGLEQEFWAWFAENEQDLFEFEKHQQGVFDELREALRRVNPNLTFEFGPVEGGRRDFVISADGIRSAFPAVASLHDAAPELPRWRFVKFRPRRRDILSVVYGGRALDPEGLRFTVEPEGGKAGVTVYLPGLKPKEGPHLLGMVFLMLDQALGEFDVETKVGSIEVEHIESAPAHAVPISELPALFDGMLDAPRS